MSVFHFLAPRGETYMSAVSVQSLGRWNGTMGASAVLGSDLSYVGGWKVIARQLDGTVEVTK